MKSDKLYVIIKELTGDHLRRSKTTGMKISTKGRYGLRILLDLALYETRLDHETPSEPRLIRDIALSQQISEKYISRLIIKLRRAGMVRSIRGAKGGFRLNKKPEDITLLEITEAMEGPIALVDCVLAPDSCKSCSQCAAHEIWNDLNQEIRNAMNRVSLKDIMNGSTSKGVL